MENVGWVIVSPQGTVNCASAVTVELSGIDCRLDDKRAEQNGGERPDEPARPDARDERVAPERSDRHEQSDRDVDPEGGLRLGQRAGVAMATSTALSADRAAQSALKTASSGSRRDVHQRIRW